MKNFAVDSLKPEMTFSEPVYIEGESVFAAAGVPVRQKDIDRLIGWGITEVHSNGVPSVPAAREPPPDLPPQKPHPLVSLTPIPASRRIL